MSKKWFLLEKPQHVKLQKWVRDLNDLYRNEPILYELDGNPAGFEWIDFRDEDKSIISFIRRGESAGDAMLAVFNFTPVPRYHYRIGVPYDGVWKEILNSDGREYGGLGQDNRGELSSSSIEAHRRTHSLSLTIPPLGVTIFKNV